MSPLYHKKKCAKIKNKQCLCCKESFTIAAANNPNQKKNECVANSLVKRCKHLKSVPKTMRKHNGAKTVAIATADVLKLELGMCSKLICESFESCEKCAQNFWGGTNVQKHQFLTILGG